MPPLVGIAVNTTLLPVQMVVWLETTLTEGVTPALTVIKVTLLFTVVGLAHAAFEINITQTESLLFNVLSL